MLTHHIGREFNHVVSLDTRPKKSAVKRFQVVFGAVGNSQRCLLVQDGDLARVCEMASPHAESFYCITRDSLDGDERKAYGGVAIGCACLGLIGSTYQVFTLRQFLDLPRKRRPAPNPNIIFFLALSDLSACLGGLLLGWWLAVDWQGQEGAQYTGLNMLNQSCKHAVCMSLQL